MPGEGRATAEIVFVGEAPGAREDEQGRPFVGAAGKLLDELLRSIELRREDIFITNILKARPPGNRDPKPGEVLHSWPWLAEQLERIRPKLVCPLGRHALGALLPGRRIGEHHGTLIAASGWSFYPLYHPAAAFRARALRATMFEDVARIPDVLAGVRRPRAGAEQRVDPGQRPASRTSSTFRRNDTGSIAG